MSDRNHIRYIAEVVIKDDRGIWAVKYFPDMDEEGIKQLAAQQYGIQPEWVMEIRLKKRPARPRTLNFDPIYEPMRLPNLRPLQWWDDEELTKGLVNRMSHRYATPLRRPNRSRVAHRKRNPKKQTIK